MKENSNLVHFAFSRHCPIVVQTVRPKWGYFSRYFEQRHVRYLFKSPSTQHTIVLCIKKQKNRWVGHFTTLSGHFLANYINIFHKIELPTIILMCLTCLNLIWIKSYDIKHIFFISCFLQFCKEKILKIYDS